MPPARDRAGWVPTGAEPLLSPLCPGLYCRSFPYLASKVAHNKSIRGPLGFLEVGAAEMSLVKLLGPAPIVALGHLKGIWVRRGSG